MRLVDADKLKAEFTGNFQNEYGIAQVKAIIDTMPTIDAEPVRHGRWLTWEDRFPGKITKKKNNLGVFCSACRLHADNKSAFCPNCGARMDGRDDE